jgi:molybdopterin converting factor small subunit
MTSTLAERAAPGALDPARRLRASMAAVRLAFTWFGVRKSLNSEQKSLAAETFGAEGKFLSAGKKLLDTRHPAFQAVTALRGRVRSYWLGMSIPYPDPGIRLLRRDQIEPFDAQLTLFRSELDEAVQNLDDHYGELRSAARERLGSLFNAGDYPPQMTGLFAIAWEFPSIEPPNYLQELNPALFEQEQARVAARFDEAVQLAEEAFVTELGKLVSHLTERLSGQEDGRPRIFRDSAVDNLREFFERFRQLNVRSNDQLDELVAQAQRIVQGVEPQQLRDNTSLRQQVATQLAGVQSVLDGLLVDRPRRAILRKPR